MKVTLNRSLQGLSGTLDDWTYRTVNGQVVVSGRAEPKPREPSPGQLAQRKKFAYAMAYAHEVLADPCQREVYLELAKRQNRRADKLVTSDYLTPPEVRRIDVSDYHGQPGGLIRVIAVDDVEVVSVAVTIQSADGAVVEQGPATRVHGVWRYVATAAAPAGARLGIVAVAEDRPGNRTRGELAYPVS